MPTARNRWILPAYFVLGAYAVCTQATVLREVQVLVFGSELSWGLVLGFWLAGVAVGAWAGGRLARTLAGAIGALTVSGLAMPLALAGTVAGLRVARGIAGAGPGEYVGPGATALLALVGTVPVSVWVGLAFPAASVLVARGEEASAERARAVARVYLAESLGALVGGMAFSFLLVGRAGALALALGGGAVLALSMHAFLQSEATRGWWRFLPATLAVIFAAAAALGPADLAERASVRWRWQTFAGRQDLVASANTRYQNVAVGRIEDQFSVYTNGLVAASWPNRADLAVKAHLAACEHPSPHRILVLGGGVEGLVAELLRHHPERLDVVLLDRRMLDLIYTFLEPADQQALDALAARGRLHFADARRFVRAAAARGERYDLVMLAAPEPASTLEARLYTLEFFAGLAGAMSDDGVLVVALGTPIGYWSEEAAVYANSILVPLEAVFPETMLTFSSPMLCFAARRRGVLTDRGDVLAERYTSRRVASPHFDPMLFEGGTDLLDPAKRRRTREALAQHPPAFVNTDTRPVAAFYHVRYWLAQSAAAHAGPEAPAEHRADVLGAIAHLRLGWAMLTAVAATAVAAFVGRLRGRAALRRTAILWSVGTTGLASMALEVVLLYTFQTLYGYVYSMVGAVIGVFMFGLVAGSLAMNRRLRRAHRAGRPGPGLLTVAVLDLAMAAFAAGLVMAVVLLRQWSADVPVQIVTFALVGVAGVLGGLVFPLAAAVTLREAGSTTGQTAGAVDAADHLGACVGAFVTGTALVPILGTVGACLTVVGLKALSALVVGLASTTKRRAMPASASRPVPLAPSA